MEKVNTIDEDDFLMMNIESSSKQQILYINHRVNLRNCYSTVTDILLTYRKLTLRLRHQRSTEINHQMSESNDELYYYLMMMMIIVFQ